MGTELSSLGHFQLSPTTEQVHVRKTSLAELFNSLYPLTPLIIRRHSYETGTVRYFKRRYFDQVPTGVEPLHDDSDGIIGYVTSGMRHVGRIPIYTSDGKPMVVVMAEATDALQSACYEYAALLNISKTAKQIQSYGVTRRTTEGAFLLPTYLRSSIAPTSCARANNAIDN